MGWLAFNMCSHHNHSSSSLLILLHVLPLLYHAQLQSWVNLFFLFCFELKYKFYSKHTHTLYIWWSQGSNPQGGTLGEGVAPLDWMPNGLESTFLIIVKWVAGKTSGLFKVWLGRIFYSVKSDVWAGNWNLLALPSQVEPVCLGHASTHWDDVAPPLFWISWFKQWDSNKTWNLTLRRKEISKT